MPGGRGPVPQVVGRVERIATGGAGAALRARGRGGSALPTAGTTAAASAVGAHPIRQWEAA